MNIARPAMGLAIGLVSEIVLTLLLPSPSLSENGLVVASAVLCGYIARHKGWLAGLLLGMISAGWCLLLLFLIGGGNLLSGKVGIPLPNTLILNVAGIVALALFSAIIGEYLYKSIHQL